MVLIENCKINDCQKRDLIWDIEELRAEVERLRAALQSLTVDPPATLDEPDTDAEVVIKMRAIAQRALADQGKG